ncbi:tripartite tricarboxylate transporter TctB family protein [Naasia lichenicola]|uniref:Uncharacterized protein n=1 Tax=Naasia lichenicola TaxID=2565933 RepID=A0A4S4FMW3_9MICO|nr:tripartite tricarboxylate transporter TctB family protein [Naasia lichenicola]THG31524.1 hypothetical protein E6C64_05455 [Naasia lichenicola]
MESDRTSTAVSDYLRRLDEELERVPEPLASQIREGVAEELRSVSDEDALTRIEQLGDPAHIAAEASSDLTAPTPTANGRGSSRAYVAATVALLTVGGLIFPILGWIVGLILLWSGAAWKTYEKVIATLSPLIAVGLIYAMFWLFSLSSSGSEPAPDNSGSNPLLPASTFAHWNALIVAVVVNVAVAAWLLIVGLRRTGHIEPR